MSVSIACNWRDLYAQIWAPEFFPKWASGLARSRLRKDGNGWLTDGPEGAIRVRFSPHNGYGVMDHWVELPNGSEVLIPLRVVANGVGAEVMLTLFRQPEMDDERFANDAEWVVRDLQKLKEIVEG